MVFGIIPLLTLYIFSIFRHYLLCMQIIQSYELVKEPLLTMACVSLTAVSTKSPLALEAAASQLMCYNPLPLFFLPLLTLAASAP